VTTAQVFSFGTGVVGTNTDLLTTVGQAIAVNATETGTAQVSYTFATDSTGLADARLVITGFDATTIAAGGDVLDLSGVGVTGADGVIARTVVTTGATLGTAVTTANIANIVEMIIGNTAAAQINGALTATGDGEAVEAAIAALRLNLAADNTVTNIYITLDNGTDTGVYRVTLTDGNGGDTSIDTVAEISNVVLVATLSGIADVGLLGAFNFG